MFSSVSNAVIDTLSNKNINSVAYIDDLAGVDRENTAAEQGFIRCGSLLKEIGLIEADKSVVQ